MGPALELEARIGAVAADLDDRLLDAADARLIEAHHLGPVAVPLGVAEIETEELRGEERRLLAARAGPDLENDVPVVSGIARQEEDLELVHESGLVGLEAFDLL